tara:strand:- start:202 stop:351 length:150 start_codon:yes stop_codon:yes gene_type:complete
MLLWLEQVFLGFISCTVSGVLALQHGYLNVGVMSVGRGIGIDTQGLGVT